MDSPVKQRRMEKKNTSPRSSCAEHEFVRNQSYHKAPEQRENAHQPQETSYSQKARLKEYLKTSSATLYAHQRNQEGDEFRKYRDDVYHDQRLLYMLSPVLCCVPKRRVS
eukprot:767685-Hanusia_phi.AAC.2